MIIGARRLILIGAIAAVALSIIFVPLIVLIPAPDFSLVDVRLSEVTVMRADERSIELRPVFTVENGSDKIVTTSRIDYELRADGFTLGSHAISFEDIPSFGRPHAFEATPERGPGIVRIPPVPGDPYLLEFREEIADVYNRIRTDPESVGWSARGNAVVESALVEEILPFDNRI